MPERKSLDTHDSNSDPSHRCVVFLVFNLVVCCVAFAVLLLLLLLLILILLLLLLLLPLPLPLPLPLLLLFLLASCTGPFEFLV